MAEVIQVDIDARKSVSGSKDVVRSFGVVGQGSDKALASVKKFGAGLGLAFSAVAITRFTKDVARSFLEFDAALNQSIAIMGDVGRVMREEMAVAAKRASEEFNFAAKDTAESFFFLASAGLTAEQSIVSLGQVMAFAKAGMFDLATATDLATDAQSALGLTVDDATKNLVNLTRVTDVLVKANTLANASVQQFSTALTTEAGAALKTFGKDIEEGVAVLAAFADQGVKGEKAGTALSRILRLMSAAAIKNADAYERLNIEVFDNTGQMRNFADILEDLERATASMSDETRTAALEQLGFQARVQGVILPLLGTSQAIREYEIELRKAGGTTRDVAEKQMQAPLERLGAAANVLRNAMFEVGESLTRALVPAMESAARNVDKLREAAIALGIALGAAGLAGAIVLMVKAWRAFIALQTVTVVLSLVTSINSLRAAIALLQISMGPVGWLILGITAITGAVLLWRRAQEKNREEIERQVQTLNEKREALTKLNQAQLIALDVQLRTNIALRVAKSAGTGQFAGQPAGISTEQGDILRREVILLKEVQRLLKENATLPELTVAVDRTSESVDLLGDTTADAEKASQELVESLRIQARQQGELTAASSTHEAILQQVIRDQELENALREAAATATGKHAEEIEALIRQIQEQKVARENLTEAERRAREENERARREAKEQADADVAVAEESMKRANALFRQGMANIQDTISGGFSDLFESGLRGFEDFAASVLDVMAGMAAQIASLMTADRLGIEKLSDEAKDALSIVSKLAGGLIGFGAGQAGGALSGALAGGLSGVLAGGPIGGAIGVGGGLLGGLFGGGEEDAERKRLDQERNRLLETNNAAIDRLVSQMDTVGTTFAEFSTIAAAAGAAFDLETPFGPQRPALPSDLPLSELEAIARELGIALRDASGALIPESFEQLAEAARLAAEQLKEVEGAFLENLEVRRLSALGLNDESDALRQSITNEKELAEARARGFDESTIATLVAVQAEEQLAREREAAGQAAEELARQEEARTSTLASFNIRRLQLEGDFEAAAIAAIQERHRQELAGLEELRASSVLSEEQFASLAAFLDLEMADAIQKITEGFEAQAEAARIASEVFSADLAIREAALAGDSRKVLELSLNAQAEAEFRAAEAAGRTAEELQRLADLLQGEIRNALAEFDVDLIRSAVLRLEALEREAEALKRVEQAELDRIAALEKASLVAIEDLEVRELIAKGENKQAEARAFELKQLRELERFISQGLSEAAISQLLQTQGFELAAFLTALEEKFKEEEEDEPIPAPSLDGLGGGAALGLDITPTGVSTVRGFESIRTGQASELIGLARVRTSLLRDIERNTRGLRGGGRSLRSIDEGLGEGQADERAFTGAALGSAERPA